MAINFFAIAPALLPPTGMIKMEIDSSKLNLFYWDKESKKWIESADLIRYFNGDQPDIYQITAEEAAKLLGKL
jgi:hypothetical protein